MLDGFLPGRRAARAEMCANMRQRRLNGRLLDDLAVGQQGHIPAILERGLRTGQPLLAGRPGHPCRTSTAVRSFVQTADREAEIRREILELMRTVARSPRPRSCISVPEGCSVRSLIPCSGLVRAVWSLDPQGRPAGARPPEVLRYASCERTAHTPSACAYRSEPSDGRITAECRR